MASFQMIAVVFLSVFLLINTVVCDEEEFTGEGEGSIRIVTVEEAENREQKSKDGDYLVIKYTAEYTDTGEQFDKSDSKSDPFYFRLGDGQVLSGWEKGLRGMCVGDKRDVYLTGNELSSDKPTAAVTPDKERGEVVYHFELIKILDKPPTPNLFKKMDFDGDNQISKTEMKAFFSAQGLGGLKEDESLDSAVENIFDFQDKDKDGTMLEFIKTGEVGGMERHGSLEDGVNVIFSGQDRDKDGFVSFDEFQGPKHDEL